MGCLFCDLIGGRGEASVVLDGPRHFAFMDIYPMRPGHVLVAPKAHASYVGELPDGEGEALFGAALRVARAIRASDLPCDDLHVVLNDGPAANQTVPHVHVHLVPRRRGDTWRLLRKILQRPAQALLGKERREVLERQAAAVRAALT